MRRASALLPAGLMRSLLFRLHLVAGVSAGIVVFLMAVTGAVLACEEMALKWAERRYRVTVPEGADRLHPARLVHSAEETAAATGDVFLATAVQYDADPRAPAQVRSGPARRTYVDPYTGEVLGGGFARIEAFFEWVRGWHRWLSFPAGSERRGRAVTGAANLAFLFLVLTGPLLWMPRRFSLKTLAAVVFFRRGIRGRARYLNWHHVVGIWSAVPFALIGGSGMLMSYPGVGDRAYPVVGKALAVGNRPGEVAEPGAHAEVGAAQGLNFPGVRALAEARMPAWRTITLNLTGTGNSETRVEVRAGAEGQPHKSGVLVVDGRTGRALGWESFGAAPPARRGQQFVRYAHTGEYWGRAGQVMAGVFALAAALMAWTGVSLASGRLRGRKRRSSQLG